MMRHSKPRILMVDDDPMLTELYSFILGVGDEFEVRVENRASDVLEAVAEFKPDLILLDLNMPEQSGSEVAAELRLADIPETKIACLSGVSGPRAGVLHGFPSFPKPMRGEDLTSIARSLLGPRRRFGPAAD